MVLFNLLKTAKYALKIYYSNFEVINSNIRKYVLTPGKEHTVLITIIFPNTILNYLY